MSESIVNSDGDTCVLLQRQVAMLQERMQRRIELMLLGYASEEDARLAGQIHRLSTMIDAIELSEFLRR